MLHQRNRLGSIAVKRYHFLQNPQIPGFTDISRSTCNQPERVIIKSAADIRIPLFRQRLILMICAAVFKLRRCDIQNPLPGPVRNQMHKAEQILAGIPKSHPPSYARFIIRSRTRHVKSNHTLIRMPDIYHSVQLFIPRLGMEFTKQCTPVLL